jgi:prolipoprotein diacylglyceryltransferase
MHPVLFRIPGLDFPLRTFGALVAGGILLSIWLWGRFLERYGDDPKNDPARGSQVALWIVVGVLVGARLMYVGVEITRSLRAEITPQMRTYLEADSRPAVAARLASEDPAALEAARKVAVGYDFLHDPFKVLLIWQGGLVMYGGLLGGVLFGLVLARKHGLEPWNALDTGLVCGFFGLMVGRWGCLFVGDDYGKPVPESWSTSPMPIGFGNGGELGPLTLRVPSREWLGQNPESLFDPEDAGRVLWATQPWMSLNALLVALAGWYWLKRRTAYGQAAAWMLMQYALSRFTIEIFRGDEIRGLWFGGRLSTSQLLSIGLFCLGLYLFVRRRSAPAPARA